MKLEESNPVTNMQVNKDPGDSVSQHHWTLEFNQFIPLVFNVTFDAHLVLVLLSKNIVLIATTGIFNFIFWCRLSASFVK